MSTNRWDSPKLVDALDFRAKLVARWPNADSSLSWGWDGDVEDEFRDALALHCKRAFDKSEGYSMTAPSFRIEPAVHGYEPVGEEEQFAFRAARDKELVDLGCDIGGDTGRRMRLPLMHTQQPGGQVLETDIAGIELALLNALPKLPEVTVEAVAALVADWLPTRDRRVLATACQRTATGVEVIRQTVIWSGYVCTAVTVKRDDEVIFEENFENDRRAQIAARAFAVTGGGVVESRFEVDLHAKQAS